MRNEIGGGGDGSAEDKLGMYAGEVAWGYLKPHFESGALFFVDPSIELREAGRVFAEDEKETVKRWLEERFVVKIEEIHARQWEDGEERFEALVVSPFVLMRNLGG